MPWAEVAAEFVAEMAFSTAAAEALGTEFVGSLGVTDIGVGVASAGQAGFSLSGFVTNAAINAAQSFALKSIAGLFAEKPATQAMDQAARAALINSVSNIDAIPVVYGTRLKGGSRILTELSGTDSEFLHLIFVWGEGPISAINALTLDGVLDSDPRFSGLIYREDYLGTDGQAASAALIAALPGTWTASCTLSGVAYTYLRLTWDQTAFVRGLPTVQATIDGRTLYDPRTTLTAFSDNPALAIRDYLTNARYGRGIDQSLIDDATFEDVADHCEDLVTAPAASGTVSQARYTCDGIVDIDSQPIDNLGSLLSSCRGFVVFSGGLYKLRADRVTTPTTFALSEDNIVGAWSITLGSKRSRFNRVKAQFFDPDQAWQPNLAVQESSVYRTADNGLVLESQISLPFTTNLYRAQQQTQIEMKASRFGITCQLTATIAAMQLEVGDVVPVTHSTPGWTAKLFRVLELELLSTDEVRLTLREYDDSVYSLDSLVYVNPPASTNLPDPSVIPAPANLAAYSGNDELFVAGDGTVITRLRVAWDVSTNQFILSGGSVIIQFKRTADSVWQDTPPMAGTAVQTYLGPVDDGVSYDVRVAFESGLNARSPWSQLTHVVVGKTALPSDITLFTIEGTRLTWSPVDDKDLAGYRVRYQPGTIRSWGDAIPMHQGLLTGSPFDMPVVPAGSVTIMVKAVDTSGNESEMAAYIVTDLGDPIVANVVEIFDLKAAGFTGTKTLCSVSGGNLVADVVASPLAWKPNEDADAWSVDSTTLAWSAAQYGQLTYIDSITIGEALAGSQLTIQSTIAGNPWSIEYRENSQKLAWSTDSTTLAWSADSSTYAWDQPAWLPWPGQITVKNSSYDIRIQAGQSTARGTVSELTLTVDAPDIDEILNDVVISAGGTRLALTAGFSVIKNVQLTVENDAGTAITARTEDKSVALGPLIKCLDAAGSATTGLVDARVQGY